MIGQDNAESEFEETKLSILKTLQESGISQQLSDDELWRGKLAIRMTEQFVQATKRLLPMTEEQMSSLRKVFLPIAFQRMQGRI